MNEAWLAATLYNVEGLIHDGGQVLLVLFGVAFLLWWFIIERAWYFYGPHR